MPFMSARAVFLLIFGALATHAAVLLEVAAGPALTASAHDAVTFVVTAPTEVRLEYGTTSIVPQNEEFACASYPTDEAVCEGTLGSSLTLLRAGDPIPVLFRSIGISYRHTIDSMIASGDDAGCLFDPGFCRATLQVGTYTLHVALDISIEGRFGGIPAPVLRSVTGQLTVFDGDVVVVVPEPAALGLTLIPVIYICQCRGWSPRLLRNSKKWPPREGRPFTGMQAANS
jgi:hypothetical protein